MYLQVLVYCDRSVLTLRNIIGFHKPDESNGYLSNWYLANFIVDGIEYSSMEQYMMHQKALMFIDNNIAEQIMNTTNVGKIKALGRSILNYNDTMWNGVRQVIVYKGLLEKFRQNSKLREQLLSTGNDILAECAVQDVIWGIGLSMSDSKRYEMESWRGQNLLGFSLMLVRDNLKNEL